MQQISMSYLTIQTQMGVIGSACCLDQQSKKAHEQEHSPIKPYLPSKPTISTTLSSKASYLAPPTIIITPIRQDYSSFNSDNLVLQKEESSKLIDISDVIQNVYPPPKNIDWNSFEIIGIIGQGGFGQVFLAELKEPKQNGISDKYAIKRVEKNKIYRNKLTPSIKLQKKIMRESKNNFIVNLYYTFSDKNYLYFVMEWAQGGDTYTLINEKSLRFDDFKQTGEEAVRFLLGCLILGLQHLHSKGYMYRDLKPENVLLFQNGYAKLSDFGLAKQLNNERKLAKTEAGTGIYHAPQMIIHQGYGLSIDIWAVGVYAYEISNYYPPFAEADMKDKYRVKKVVQNAEAHRLWKNPDISDELKDFIDSILRYDPTDRLGINGFQQMKEHKFFKSASFDWEGLSLGYMQSPIKHIIESNKIRVKPYLKCQIEATSPPNYIRGQSLQCWTSPWINQ